ncbi:hypothetical protein [Limnoglobus roseus]|nr:hypothetical protein [Limnoglobus roseus]
MKTLKLIRDGMNLPFSLRAWGPNGPALTGVFRPMSSAEVADLQRAAKAAGEAGRLKVVTKALAGRVVS